MGSPLQMAIPAGDRPKMGFLGAGQIDTGDALRGPIVAMVSVQGPLRRRGLERRVTGIDQTILCEGDVLMTFLALMLFLNP